VSIQKKYIEELIGGFSVVLSLLVLVVILGILLLFLLAYATAPISQGFPGISHYFINNAENFCGSSWVLLSLLPISIVNLVMGLRLKGSLSRGWKAAAWGSLITGSLGILVSLALLALFWLDKG
jgi:hypothetical protein